MMQLLSVLAVVLLSVFQLIANGQSPVMDRHSSQQMDNIAGDISDMKAILTDLKNVFVKPCPKGYMNTYYGCYKFGLDNATAYEAWMNCSGQLVTVTSVGEYLALQSLMMKNNLSLDNDYWTSGQKTGNSIEWDYSVTAVSNLDSKILTETQKDTLRQWFPKQTTFKLLYRATRDGMSGRAFHNKCDGKGPTISIGRKARTRNVYGGYTSVSWSGPSGGEWKADKNAFIFKLCEGSCSSSKYDVKVSGQSYAILDQDDNGPAFGRGSDLEFFSAFDSYSYDATKKYFHANRDFGFGFNCLGYTYTGVLGCGSVNWTDVEVHQVLGDCTVLRRGDQRLAREHCEEKHPYICEA